MSSFESTKSPRRKNPIVGYAISLVLLVAIIGGIAWIAQNLPKWNKPNKDGKPAVDSTKMLQFTRSIAQWGKKPELGAEEKFIAKDVEAGEAGKGYYDFPFKNVATEDVLIAFYSTSCDCASMQAAVIEASEWEPLNAQHVETPAEPLTYADKVVFQELIKDAEWFKLNANDKKAKGLLIKPGDGGIVRVRWHAKTAGSPLNVTPKVIYHLASDDSKFRETKLGVPVMVANPVQFQPSRIVMEALTSGTSTRKEFFAWSSTRSHFDLKLSSGANDALFHTEATTIHVGGIFSRNDIGELTSTFDKEKPTPTVRSAQRVTLTVHESRNGQYLDLGSYFRKLDVHLDGRRMEDIPGPEVLGRVHGAITIGGADDQARVRLKAFQRRDGTSKTIELSADPNWKLEVYRQEPAWLNVKLMRDKEQDDPKHVTWRLQVAVPANAPGVRSLEDPDSVMLKIPGNPVRFVRIPIEGQLSGP